MKGLFLADIKRLSFMKYKLCGVVVGYIMLFSLMIGYYHVTDASVLIQVYSMVTIFLLSMFIIVFAGELFEKKIIRYYLEASKKRRNILIVLWVEAILCYAICTATFLITMKILIPHFLVDYYMILVYSVVYSLFSIIILIMLIHIRKVGPVILCALVLLWIVPAVCNTVLLETSIYSFQIFYYLNPDDMFRYPMNSLNIMVFFLYLLGGLMLAFYSIERGEF